MGDSATAMRDPVFYRWHSYVDDLFNMHKARLTPYTSDTLDFPGVRASSISVSGAAGRNTFGTFWEQSSVDLSRGLDFTPRGAVLARFTHLQHEPFVYNIECTNSSGRAQMATVRIFMAPRDDENGRPLDYEDQRRMMIELDKFTHNLRPGNETITRRSSESSVTIPYERTFREQSDRDGEPGSQQAAEFDFCGCGWPQHMLLPKGNTRGFPVVLFVMLSDWSADRVQQDLVGVCTDAASYCGLRDRRYPDRRSMGYPFDRPMPTANALSDILTGNMAVAECSVRFTDTTRQRTQTQ